MAHDAHAIPQVPTHQEVASDIMARFQDVNRGYWRWISLLALLFAAGIVGFVIRFSSFV